MDDAATPADAPGQPGLSPAWTSSAKDAVGGSLGAPRLWFTIGHGIVNEVYYPRIDIPQIRDLGFIIADGKGFWSEVKRVADYNMRFLAPGVPAYEITHRHDHYSFRLRVSPDPRREVLAIEFHLDAAEEFRAYVLLAPHLGATGHGNRAAVETHAGRRVLVAAQGPFALALAVVDQAQRDALGAASAGYVGDSDGWHDFQRNGALTWAYDRAGPGNVALIGELPRAGALGLGFGSSATSAATLAVASLLQPVENILRQQIAEWEGWHALRSERYAPPIDLPAPVAEEFLVSTAVLRTHLDKTYPGAMVASLSIPWGDTGDERGGYHLVWPRDLVSCAGALLAFGAEAETRDTLRYLIATQHADGHWNQNQWLGGKAFWTGQQLDETAFPVLLAATLAERSALGGIRVEQMMHRALGFIAATGPVTGQERWEENSGISPYTLAVLIAALVEGSAFLPEKPRAWALDLADFWNSSIEAWCSVRGTDLAARLGVNGYYVRIAPPDVLQRGAAAMDGPIPIRNHSEQADVPAKELVAVDFLQLVRFGLRQPDDPLILDSITVADSLLRMETPYGPVWKRYTADGYGEHDDGAPYDGTGRGRPWPLLAGERGHYEVAAGRDPLPFLLAMCGMASPLGLLPEQVWDGPEIPARDLKFGRPTGSARPLAWAHAEFAKLVISRQLGAPCDRPGAVWRRYQGQRPRARRSFWSPHAPIGDMPQGTSLVVMLPKPARVRWRSGDGPETEATTEDTGLGLHAAGLETTELPAGSAIDFAWRWCDNPDAAQDGGRVIVGGTATGG
ncbi:glycoside hydrolase family 15 protein [Rhodopila globiformis]|uniref:Glycosyl hydrolase n=1 Tax=Rhodopila globiformis TaxID=1071 RepID=A0A2S6NLG5_RHOGL|nr:glycoside hydrolase family 15 protein [Rhodopila globiformis]PPQ36097.1 glycosyl hydrolase [Rhodopila globiformis]